MIAELNEKRVAIILRSVCSGQWPTTVQLLDVATVAIVWWSGSSQCAEFIWCNTVRQTVSVNLLSGRSNYSFHLLLYNFECSHFAVYCNVGCCVLLLPCVDSYVILSSVQLIYGEKQCRRIIVSKLGLHQCLRSSNSRPMYSSFSTFSSQPTCFM